MEKTVYINWIMRAIIRIVLACTVMIASGMYALHKSLNDMFQDPEIVVSLLILSIIAASVYCDFPDWSD